MAVYQYPGSGASPVWTREIQWRFLQGKYGKPFIYEGRTLNATPTELFIEGKTNRRLFVPRQPGFIYLEINGIAYNATDGNVATVFRGAAVAAERLANGTFQLANGLDFDGTGTENQSVTLGTAGQGINVVRFGAANALAVAVQGSGAANDPYLSLTATGTAAKTVLWRLEVTPHYVSAETEQDLTEGV